MAGIEFEAVQMDSEIEWPKRGRRKSELPPTLVAALHQSFEHGSTPHLVIASDKLNTFTNMLNRAGRELNYRIEKVIKPGEPEKGKTTVYFRTKHRRNAEND